MSVSMLPFPPTPTESLILSRLDELYGVWENYQRTQGGRSPGQTTTPSIASSQSLSQLPPSTRVTSANLNQAQPTYLPRRDLRMLPPPPRLFATRDEGVSWIQAWPLKHGYKLPILHSSKKGRRNTFGCWMHAKKPPRHSSPPPDQTEDRTPENEGAVLHPDDEASSDQADSAGEAEPVAKKRRKTFKLDWGCPFKLRLNKRDDGMWELKHEVTEHSAHPAVANISDLTLRFSEKQREIIRNGAALGQTTAQVYAALDHAELPARNFKKKRISNALTRSRKESDGDYATAMMALLGALRNDNSPWYYATQSSSDNHLQALFMMHTNAREALKSHWHVLSMDCTYSTNIHRLKLLNIVGRAPTGQSFLAAHCFLVRESQPSFMWALECLQLLLPPGVEPTFIVDRDRAMMAALPVVFPESPILLCIWHIMKNVRLHILKKVQRDDDEQTETEVEFAKRDLEETVELLLHAKSPDDEDSLWAQIEEMRVSNPGRRDFINYFEREWWQHKECWVYWRTARHLTFTKRSTGAAESAHSRIKRHLPGRSHTLESLKKAFELLALDEHAAIAELLTKQLTKSPTYDVRTPLARDFLGPVNHQIAWPALDTAMREIAEGHKLFRAETIRPFCTCPATTNEGVPCRHWFARAMERIDCRMRKEDFHPSQWLPDRWAVGPVLSNDDRQFAVSGNGISDIVKTFESQLEGMGDLERSVQMDKLRESIRVSDYADILAPRKPALTRGQRAHHRRRGRANARMPDSTELHKARERAAQRTCGRCRETGHDARVCPAPTPVAPQEDRRVAVCRVCGQRGHITSRNRACPFNPARLARASSSNDEVSALAEAGARDHYSQHNVIRDDLVAMGAVASATFESGSDDDFDFDDESDDELEVADAVLMSRLYGRADGPFRRGNRSV